MDWREFVKPTIGKVALFFVLMIGVNCIVILSAGREPDGYV
jgi:hypothetical protein